MYQYFDVYHNFQMFQIFLLIKYQQLITLKNIMS